MQVGYEKTAATFDILRLLEFYRYPPIQFRGRYRHLIFYLVLI